MKHCFLFWGLFISLAGMAQDTASHEIPFDGQPIATVDSFRMRDTLIFSKLSFAAFKKLAAYENKPYFIMFSASWCAPCQRVKNDLFTNRQIVSLANKNYLAFYIDLEDFDGAEINSRFFKVSKLPTIIFFDPTGHPTDQAIGFYDGYYLFRKLREHIPPSKWGEDWGQ